MNRRFIHTQPHLLSSAPLKLGSVLLINIDLRGLRPFSKFQRSNLPNLLDLRVDWLHIHYTIRMDLRRFTEFTRRMWVYWRLLNSHKFTSFSGLLRIKVDFLDLPDLKDWFL